AQLWRISQIVRLRVHGPRSARHQVARKSARIGTNLADQIEHLEAKVADLNAAAPGKPSPATGRAMLRPWPGEERFGNAKIRCEKDGLKSLFETKLAKPPPVSRRGEPRS